MMDREDYKPSFVSEADRALMRREWFFLRRFGSPVFLIYVSLN
jgi:hypothetical protein